MGLGWLFRRRRKAAPAPGPDPAEELKAKLADSRVAEPEAEPVPPAPPEAPLEEKRDAVHRRGRESIERMRGETPPAE
jgi:hypothetical protein